MPSLRFILACAFVCAASGVLAGPRILEVQQAQEPAPQQAQEQAQDKPQDKSQDKSQGTPQDKAPEATPPQPQAQAPAQPAAAPAQPPKKQAVQPAPAPAPAASQPALPPQPARDQATNASARFGFRRVDGGILRLDSASGQVAVCASHDAGWACQAVPEERAALEQEIARLQGEVTGLKDQIASLRKEIATLREPPPPAPRPPADLAPRSEDHGGFKMPSDEDIAHARAAIVDAWQRLMDMIGKFQRDMTRKATPPDRTTL